MLLKQFVEVLSGFSVKKTTGKKNNTIHDRFIETYIIVENVVKNSDFHYKSKKKDIVFNTTIVLLTPNL